MRPGDAHPADTELLVLEALEADQDSPIRIALRRLLRRREGLADAQRATIARRVLAITCLRARLDFLIAAAGGPPHTQRPCRSAWRLAAYLRTEEKLPADRCSRLAGLLPDTAHVLERLDGAQTRWPAEPVERLCARRSLPAWLARLWIEERGETDADALAAATNWPGPITVRANTLRGGRDELARALLAEGIPSVPARFSPWGLHLCAHPNIYGLTAWRDGLFEVQDEASQLAVLAAAPEPGQLCVDLCAGTGGKTLALAALMQNRGELIAADNDPARLAHLPARLSRAGATNVTAVDLRGGEAPLAACRERADVVLVDAPCSALGTLRRDPEARWRTSPKALEGFPPLQRDLLAAGAGLVRPGGRLVYATCTVRRAENEDVAGWLEAARPGFEPLGGEGLWGGSLAAALGAAQSATLLPHRHGTDGFFLAAWRRT